MVKVVPRRAGRLQERYFTRNSDGRYVVVPEIRKCELRPFKSRGGCIPLARTNTMRWT